MGVLYVFYFFLYILNKVLYQIYDLRVLFSPVYSLSYHPLDKIFFRAIVFNLTNLLVFPFMYYNCGVKVVISLVYLNVKDEKEEGKG